MDCPRCGIPSPSEVAEAARFDAHGFVMRRRECVCGLHWDTEEVPIKGAFGVFGVFEGTPNGPQMAKGGTSNTSNGYPKHDLGYLKSKKGYPKSEKPEKGDLSFSDPIFSSPVLIADPDPDAIPVLRSTKRGKNKPYSDAFEDCWRAYGRKEEKGEAFKRWGIIAPDLGGEENLRVLILTALKWQAPIWAESGWKYAVYFSRYLSRRKWQDEPPPPVEHPRPEASQQRLDVMRSWVNGGAK